MKFLYFFLLAFFAITISLYSQSVKTVLVDTLMYWSYSGEIPDIKFTNHGNSLVYFHEGKIYEYSIPSKKNVREIPIQHNQRISNINVDANSKYIFYEVKADTSIIVADYNTGKILKTLKGTYCLSKDYLLYFSNKHYPDKIIIYGVNLTDLEPIDNLTISLYFGDGVNKKFNRMRTIQGTNLLLVSFGGYQLYRGNVIQLSNRWTLLDFDNGTSKLLPVYAGEKNYPSNESDLITTKNMKYYAIGYHFYTYPENNNGSTYHDSFITIWDSNSTKIIQIKESELREQLNDKQLFILLNIQIIDDKYLVFNVKDIIQSKDMNNRLLVYDLDKKELFKIIDYDLKNYDYNYDRLALIGYFGLAKLDIDAVPVEESHNVNENFSISFIDNSLKIKVKNSNKANLEIYNSFGQSIVTMDEVYLNQGDNQININEQLICGVYFCLIKTEDTTIIKKFIVIR